MYYCFAVTCTWN